MSRPRKGVGEHRLLKKGPLLVTTALLSFYPVCVAEAATSSFEKRSASSLSGAYTHSKNHQSQTTLLDRLQNQPRNYQDPRLLSLVPLSIETLDNLKSTLSNYQNQLNTLKNSAPKDPKNAKDYALAITDVENRISDLKTRISALESGLKSIQEAQNTLQNAISRLQASQTALTTSTAQKLQAIDAYNIAKSNLDVAQNNLDSSMALKTQADAALTQQNGTTSQSLTILNEHRALKTLAQSNLQAAQDALHDAQQAQQQAQTNYDTNLIPDPDWTPPTYQKENIRVIPETIIVEEVTTTTQQSENILPPLDHTTWSGAGTGAQGSQPTINNGVVKYSYTSQTVSYTANTNSPANTPLVLSVDVKNQDANRGIQDTYKIELFTYNAQGQQNGYAVYNSPQGWHDWTIRTISTTPTSDVASYQVRLTGFDGGFWWGTYGPEMMNPTLSATVTTTTITYREETIYRYETYYTTEPVLIEGTIDVSINEGGQATFTAPEGATFTGSSLRYEAIQRPQCGININPPVQGKTQITIQASNGVWGDPCGGWYKHVVGTLSYLGQPTAPLIKDPALLIPLQEANANLVEAENQASSAAQTLNEATSEVTAAEEYYNSQLGKSQEAQTSYEQASLKVEEDKNILLSSTSIHDLSLTDVDAKTSAELGASAELTLATQNKEEIENSLGKLQTSNEASLNLAEDASSRIPSALEDAIQLQTKEPEPLPEPEPEGSVEIPKDLSADNLMDVDLEAVDPTELTSEQAEQLVEAALETFETAVEGSAEYEQALDALALAAQEDDIVLDESIAAIPGVGQAAAAVVAVFNIVGNVGADISPKVRKKAQQVVVTTLVVGQIAQNAAMAATASAAFRRRN